MVEVDGGFLVLVVQGGHKQVQEGEEAACEVHNHKLYAETHSGPPTHVEVQLAYVLSYMKKYDTETAKGLSLHEEWELQAFVLQAEKESEEHCYYA